MSSPGQRPGGRVPGTRYAPGPPRSYGTGRFPYRDYSDVQPAVLREALEMWQDICLDIRERRFARGLEQAALAEAAGVAANTVARLEVGEWVSAPNLLLVCAALGLRVEQAVPVRRRTT